MKARFQNLRCTINTEARSVLVEFRLVNASSNTWRQTDDFMVGWQMYDPDTSTFIMDGEWLPLSRDLEPGQASDIRLTIELPPERGRYHVYVSPLQERRGWSFQQGHPFVLLEAFVEGRKARLIEARLATLRSMRVRQIGQTLSKFFAGPFQALNDNLSLIRSLSKRDVLMRYRGSAGDVLWTILHPLLLMGTYFFVFGIVLQSRYGADTSKTAFALFFLAAMLPWLAISEAIGRAPSAVVQHANFVKKLIFPVVILPVIQVVSGLATQAFATGVFLIALIAIRGSIPWAIVWIPLLLIPQFFLTMGVSWALSALGVYLRDLGQIIGFLLTLCFFMTPICYPETALPPEIAPILLKNPIYALVRGYRQIFLEGRMPDVIPLIKLWSLGIVVFLFGHALFYKLRKSFADVI